MNITYETRLTLDAHQKEIIDEYCQEFSHIAKVAWKLKNNQHLADALIFSFIARLLGPNRHKRRTFTHELIFMCNLYDEPEVRADPELNNLLSSNLDVNPFENTVSMSQCGVRATHATSSNLDELVLVHQ